VHIVRVHVFACVFTCVCMCHPPYSSFVRSFVHSLTLSFTVVFCMGVWICVFVCLSVSCIMRARVRHLGPCREIGDDVYARDRLQKKKKKKKKILKEKEKKKQKDTKIKRTTNKRHDIIYYHIIIILCTFGLGRPPNPFLNYALTRCSTCLKYSFLPRRTFVSPFRSTRQGKWALMHRDAGCIHDIKLFLLTPSEFFSALP
jgi:hypothetical protein